MTRVNIVQDESADASVVEVFAPDEIGLLATVARVCAEQELDVTIAKVATTGELAVDVFYVRDRGEKIDPDRARTLAAVLLSAVGGTQR
jgi:[protein-PII] uridylyltransferase